MILVLLHFFLRRESSGAARCTLGSSHSEICYYAHSCGDINTGNIPAISDFSYNTKLVFRDWEDSKDLAVKSLDLMEHILTS
jgi:hypothetical protein